MSEHTPTPWTLGRTSERSQTVYIDAMHRDPDMGHETWREMIACAGCYDLPDKGIEKAEANARFVVKAANYHERLREALQNLVDYSEHKNHWGEVAESKAVALLAELDNLEKQQWLT